MPPEYPYPQSPAYTSGVFGGWTLVRKPAESRELGYYSGLDVEPPGHYIVHGGDIWMSTSRLERESHALHLKHARGRVVVCGVGMGMFLFNIALLPQVTEIIAVDRDPAVFDLVRKGAGFEKWVGGDKIRFLHRDMMELTAADLGPAPIDYLYIDIWPELGDPVALQQTQAVQKVVKAKAVGWWGQELDFVEWAYRRATPELQASRFAPTFDDLRDFIAMTGLPMGDLTEAYAEACRRAADVYAMYGILDFAVAARHERELQAAM